MSGWQSRHKETFQSDWIMPPIVNGIVAISVTNTITILDLTTFPGCQANNSIPSGNDNYNPNPIGHYFTGMADGGDIYYAYGPSVSSLNAINTTAQATVTANKITKSPNDTIKLPNGVKDQFKLPLPINARADGGDVGLNSPCRYLALLCATGVTATFRAWQSSP